MQTEIIKVPIATERDIVRARNAVRDTCKVVGLGIVDETRIVTAASELGRNLVFHAHGDRHMDVSVIEEAGRTGVRVVSQDEGPGIPDVDQALVDGHSTGGSLGVGLPGTRRIVDDFHITTDTTGTTVEIIKWKR